MINQDIYLHEMKKGINLQSFLKRYEDSAMVP